MNYKKAILCCLVVLIGLSEAEIACSQVVINEVMHKPGPDASTNQGFRRKEYVEIYNPNCYSVNIGCWIIGSASAGLGTAANPDYIGAFQFPPGTLIAPGQHIVVGGSQSQNGTPYPASYIDFDVGNYIGTNTCDPKTNWLMTNGDGSVALYNSSGVPIDAVYWSLFSGPNINTDDDYNSDACTPAGTGCSSAGTIRSVRWIFNNYPTRISYVGLSTNNDLTFSRIPDGGAWQRNIAPSINPAAASGRCNGGSCVSVPTVTFTANVTQPTCGSNNGSITLTVTSAGNATFVWTPNPSPTNTTTSTSASGLSANSYQISVTQNGCTKDTTIVLTAANLPNANAGTDKSLTCTTTSVVLNGSSTTPGVTYSWSGPGIVSGGNTASPTVNAAGTYTLTVTVTATGCTNTDQAVVSANTTPPNANAGSDKTLTCTTTSVVLNGSSTTPGVTYNWSGPGIVSGGNTATPTVNAGGTYTLTVTETATGCTNTDQAVVTANTTQPNANAGSDKTLTCTTTSVTLNGSSTTPGVTYSWSGPGIVSGGSTATPTVNAAGTYTLTVTITATGCTNTDQAVVTSNTTLPNANAGSDKTLTCSVTSVVLNGSSTTPGVTYSWSGPGIVSGGNTATPTVNAAGTYTLTVTETATGCTNTDQAVVTAGGSLPNANAGTDKTLTCTTTSVTLNGSSTTPGVTYSWSGPGIVSGGSTATPTVNAAGTYTLTVTETATGCTNSDQAVVTSNTTLPNANAGSDKTITCTTTSVTLNGSSTTPGVTYSWSGPGIVSGGNTATPTVNVAGTYTLTVTETASGCTNTDQAIVTSNTTLPNANAGSDKTLTCSVTSVVLNGSSTTPGVTYSWSGPGIVSGGNTASPTVNAAGTYTLTVTETATGCVNTDQAVVSSSATLPNANAGSDKTLTCTTPTTVLNGSSSTPGVTYNWSGPGIVSGGSTATPTVNAAGTYTLTVTETATGCTNTDQAVVTAGASLPNANAGSDKTLTCTTTSLVLNGSSTTPGVTYSWSGPGIVSGGNTPTPTVNAAGTYTLTVTETATGCTNTDQAVVSSSAALPNANAGTDKTLTCTTTSLVLNGSSTTPGVTYSWSGPGIVSGGNTASPTVNAAGTYTLTVTETATGCNNTDQVIVSSSATLPNANAGSDKTLTCTATSVTLDGSSTTPGVTYSWSGPGIASGGSTATPSVNAAGTYTLTVTETATGCSSTDQVIVNSSASVPNVSAGSAKSITCATPTVILDGSSTTAGVTYNWSGPGIVSGGNTATPTVNAAGTYTLTVTETASGCTAQSTVLVDDQTSVPTVTVSADKNPVDYGEVVTLSLSASVILSAINWQPADLVSDSTAVSTTAQIKAPQRFTVLVADANGCTATASIDIRMNYINCLYVPNTFTPNSNGRNDTFRPLGDKLKSLNAFRIFDRWGNLVFETDDVNVGWDGYFNGQLLDPGVYVYYIEGVCITNNYQSIKGDVTLIR